MSTDQPTLSPTARLAALPRWVLLLAVALVARAITFGNPVVHVDEEFYFVTARTMIEGAWPYIDVWDRKPAGLFLVYLPAAAFGLPLGIWVYQAMALACVTGTAMLVARLCDRANWSKGALPAAIAYILWLNFVDGQGGQAPVFYNLLMTGAAALIAPFAGENTQPGRRLALGLAAMALVGISLQIKYSVVFEGFFFGLWWMWREWRQGRSVPSILALGALLAAVTALPTLAAWGLYAAHGAGQEWLYANFQSIAQRKPDPMPEQLGNLFKIVLITSPLVALAVMGWAQRGGVAIERAMQHWLFAWCASAVLGLLVFGSWFEHYALPVIAPLVCCGAGFLSNHRRAKIAMILLLGWGLIGGEATLFTKRHNRGDAAQFAALNAAIGKGPGCLYVYSGTPMMYAGSERCRLTRWIFPSHLGRLREQGAIGVDQQAEITRILAQNPQVVVLRSPYFGERTEMRALVMTRMTAAYRLKGVFPMGNDRLSVYELR